MLAGMSEAPKEKEGGKGLSPMGWARVVLAGAAIGTPLYVATQHALEQHQSAPEALSSDIAPGIILHIDPVAQEEEGVAMVDVTVFYQGVEQKLRMPATEAADFSENQEVDVDFSVRVGREQGEVEVRINSISLPGDPA